MAILSLLMLALRAASVEASPRKVQARGREGNPGSGTDSGPSEYSQGGTWGSRDNGWDSSEYGGSWGHSMTSVGPASQYSGGEWGHGSTCVGSTVVDYSTLTVDKPGPTVYISGSGTTKTLEASTVYISGSDHTSYLPASTVYLTGADRTSYLPASTVTVAGPANISLSTIFNTITRSAAPTTVFVTQNGPGWNRTVTYEETDFVTKTQHEVSTVYNEETTIVTSAVTLPGEYQTHGENACKPDFVCICTGLTADEKAITSKADHC